MIETHQSRVFLASSLLDCLLIERLGRKAATKAMNMRSEMTADQSMRAAAKHRCRHAETADDIGIVVQT